MEFTGLIKYLPFSVNRPLTAMEQEYQLRQQQRLEIRISHELTVIETNSHWMEIVDKYYFDKGTLAMVYLIFGPFLLIGSLLLTFGAFYNLAQGELEAVVLLLPAILGFSIAWLAWSYGSKFDFNLTHYPIRFNRQTGMVHVMRYDGSVLTAQWNKLFFTQVRRSGNAWDMVAHVLADDKVTVLETFALPGLAVGSTGRDAMKGYWEFLRRYMEDGPASVFDNISCCVPIKDKKETALFRYQRLAFSFGPLSPFIPFYFLCYPGRWLAMRLSKIPQWPAEIEAQCPRPQQLDPYFRDASMNKTRFGHLL